MGFRLFRRVSIIPGVRLNLSKSGVSVSVGKRGANLTLGKKGPRVTVGLPGTGLSYTETFKGQRERHEPEETPEPPPPSKPRFSRATSRYDDTFLERPRVHRPSATTPTPSRSDEEEKPGGCAIFITVALILVSYLWWTGWFD